MLSLIPFRELAISAPKPPPILKKLAETFPISGFFFLKNVAAHPQAVPIPLHWLPTPFHERGLFPGGFSQLPSQSVSEGDEQVSPHEFFILQGKEGHHYENKSSLVLPSMPELEMSVAPSSPPTGHSLVQLDPS